MYKIDEGLFQGGLPKNDFPEDIKAIVSITRNPPTFKNNTVEYYMWFPIEDGPFPGLIWLKTVVGVIESFRKNDISVYIHCREGVSRSVMVLAAYLMKDRAWSMDRALEFISKANPTLNPNPRFILGLKEWQNSL